MLEHELRGLFEELSEALAQKLRPIIREEIKRMTDPLQQAVADLTTATTADTALISQLLTAVQDQTNGISASAAAGDAAAVEAQVKNINDAITAAKAVLASLQTPPAPSSPVASPAPASPAPSASAPAAAPAASPAPAETQTPTAASPTAGVTA